MNKQDEINALHAFIQAMPTDSYIRPWMVEIAPHVENIIRGDMPVELCPRQAYLDALKITKDAQETAKQIVQRAEDDAASIRFAAQRTCAELRTNAQAALRRIADSI
jgi:hypothetical protein